MKLAIGLLLVSFVALTFAQFQCVTDADCTYDCFLHVSHQCRDGVCHCFLALGDLLGGGGDGRRQTCAEHGACICADGTQGHCDHAGVCHCHH